MKKNYLVTVEVASEVEVVVLGADSKEDANEAAWEAAALKGLQTTGSEPKAKAIPDSGLAEAKEKAGITTIA